jgi:hypothetical protein
MIVIFMSFLWVDGLALYPFVILKSTNPPAYLLNHERIHLRQQLELALLPFYIWYFAEYGYYRLRGLRHYDAYRAIRFEREAFAHDENLDYLKTRPFWGFLKG